MGTLEVQVLVVGGGGCGLAMSNFLSDHGVGHLVVERHAGTSNLPKAHYLNQRTMGILRQHGLDEPVVEQAAPLEKFGKVRWQTTLAGDGELDARLIHEMDAFGGGDLRETYAEHGPLLPSKLPQILLEPILRRYAEERNPGRVLFGHELTGFTDEGDRVVAEIREVATGELTTVVAEYLIAADGGRTVGGALGVRMEPQGAPVSVQVATVYFAADLSAHWHEGTLITHLLDPSDPALSVNLIEMGPTWGKGCQEWGLHFAPGQAAGLDERTIVPKMREVLRLPDLDPVVHGVTHWTVDAVVADRYRVGRVLLAGDAVHRQPPAVGLGLNTGIQDAHNLAWKLAAVLGGRAPDSLLDSYEAERRPIGVQNVAWAVSAASHHRVILDAIGLGENIPPRRRGQMLAAYFDPSPLGDVVRARTLEIFGTHRGGCQALDVEIGFAYEAGAIVPDGSEPPVREPMRVVHHPTTRPGHVLPHAWLERGGVRLSTHDLVGAATTFVLVTGPEGDVWSGAADELAERFDVPLRVARIGPGAEFADAEGGWEAVRQIGASGAVLVRPDNHVAWRIAAAGADPAGELERALAAVLDRSPVGAAG